MPGDGQAQRLPRAMSEVTDLYLGFHRNTSQNVLGSYWNLISFAEHGQSQRDMDHVSLRLSPSIQREFSSLYWKSIYISMTGYVAKYVATSLLATHTFLNCKICSLSTHLMVITGRALDYKFYCTCRCNELFEPQFPHPSDTIHYLPCGQHLVVGNIA